MVFQHELDHLEGLLLSDVGLEIDDDFKNGTDEEKDKIINYYLESLDLRKKELDKEFENNAELKELKDGVDFMSSVLKGET